MAIDRLAALLRFTNPTSYKILRQIYRRVSARDVRAPILEIADRLTALQSKVDVLLGMRDELQSIRLTLNQVLDEFSDLREEFRRRSSEQNEVVGRSWLIAHALEQLNSDSRKALAIVSILPPIRSGVAKFTLEAFSIADYPIDFFVPSLDCATYFAHSGRLAALGGRHRIMPLELLPIGLCSTDYEASIFVLGNSHHHVSVYEMLRRAAEFGVRPLVHLHDPSLWGLTQHVLDGADIESLCEIWYCDRVFPTGAATLDLALQSSALGTRPLLASVAIGGVIVNSFAAADLLAAELPSAPVRKVFHPIFETPPIESPGMPRNGSNLRVGTFGVPSPEKRTQIVLSAFALLRSVHPHAELLLAGYGAQSYADIMGVGSADGVIAYEPDSDAELLSLMASSDVAVQLRARNLGESSGIMAQLMRVNTPVIACDLGAFREYRSAARLVDPQIGSEELAAVMEYEARSGNARSGEAARLVSERSPSVFCQAFYDAVQSLVYQGLRPGSVRHRGVMPASPLD